MCRIVVLDAHVVNPGDLSWECLKALGESDIFDRTPADQVAERLLGHDLALTNKTPITAEDLGKAPEIRYVGVISTGYDVVDVDFAKSRGVTVTNVPTYGTSAVAQHSIALMLEICKRVGHHSHAVRQGRWSRSLDYSFWDYPMIELDGKTLGAVGVGHIGMAAAVVAHAMGMRVVAHDLHAASAPEWMEFVELDELWARADVINMGCPLTPETAGMINRGSIAAMKDGVVIVNTMRGGLIEESDLAAALASGKVRGAGLDVVSVEPIRPDNPLLGAPNCLITPHMASTAIESRGRLLDTAVDNARRYLAGTPVNVVNS